MLNTIALTATFLLVIGFTYAVTVAPAATAVRLGLFTAQQLTDAHQ